MSKNKKIVEKASESVHPWFVYFLQVMTSYQENKQLHSLLSVEYWQPIVQQHVGIMVNVEIGS